jgi:hypothetical protein
MVMDKGNVMSDTRLAFEKIERKFTSANSVDVERSVILKSEWELAKQFINKQASRQALDGEAVLWWDGNGVWDLDECVRKAPTSRHTIPLYTRPASTSGEEVWEKAMMAAIGEDGPKSVADAIGRLKTGSVPEGWKIDPFNGVSGIGITVIWPDGRGGAHIRTNDPQNSIEQNLLHDLAQALVCGSQPINRPGLGLPVSTSMPQPIKTDECCCGECEEAWRLCPFHSGTSKQEKGQ